ncbi:MAG: hypothetical protein AB7E72_09415 [Lysobacterales bacterium]
MTSTDIPTGAAVPAAPPEVITLRDLAACHALSGMIPAPKVPGVLPLTPDGMAQAAYAYADAMLRARLLPPKVVK